MTNKSEEQESVWSKLFGGIGKLTEDIAKDHPEGVGFSITTLLGNGIGTVYQIASKLFPSFGNQRITISTGNNENTVTTTEDIKQVKTNAEKERERKRKKKLSEISNLNEDIKELKRNNFDGKNDNEIKKLEKQFNSKVAEFKLIFGDNPLKFI